MYERESIAVIDCANITNVQVYTSPNNLLDVDVWWVWGEGWVWMSAWREGGVGVCRTWVKSDERKRTPEDMKGHC